MLRVMVVCSGNICRSPMAAGLLKYLLVENCEQHIGVESAGTHAVDGLSAEPHAVVVMAELGIDMRHHRSRNLDAASIRPADLILVMEKDHAEFIDRRWPEVAAKTRQLCDFSAEPYTFDIPDPYGGSIDTYRHCADLIRTCLTGVVAYLGYKVKNPE